MSPESHHPTMGEHVRHVPDQSAWHSCFHRGEVFGMISKLAIGYQYVQVALHLLSKL